MDTCRTRNEAHARLAASGMTSTSVSPVLLPTPQLNVDDDADVDASLLAAPVPDDAAAQVIEGIEWRG